MAENNPPAEEKKPNPILTELDKQAAEQTAATSAETPVATPSAETKPAEDIAPAQPPASEVPTPAPVESKAQEPPSPAPDPSSASGDAPDQLVSDAMQRLDEILKKVKQKKSPPAVG